MRCDATTPLSVRKQLQRERCPVAVAVAVVRAGHAEGGDACDAYDAPQACGRPPAAHKQDEEADQQNRAGCTAQRDPDVRACAAVIGVR